jgi:hypothetical protein
MDLRHGIGHAHHIEAFGPGAGDNFVFHAGQARFLLILMLSLSKHEERAG